MSDNTQSLPPVRFLLPVRVWTLFKSEACTVECQTIPWCDEVPSSYEVLDMPAIKDRLAELLVKTPPDIRYPTTATVLSDSALLVKLFVRGNPSDLPLGTKIQITERIGEHLTYEGQRKFLLFSLLNSKGLLAYEEAPK